MTTRMRSALLASLVLASGALAGCQSTKDFYQGTSGYQRSESIDEFLGRERLDTRARNAEIDSILYKDKAAPAPQPDAAKTAKP
jgi:hypothetical protein